MSVRTHRAASMRSGRRLLAVALLVSIGPNARTLIDAIGAGGLPRAIAAGGVSISLIAAAVVVFAPDDPAAAVGMVIAPVLTIHWASPAANGGDFVAVAVGTWLAAHAVTSAVATSRAGGWRSASQILEWGARWQVHFIYASSFLAKLRTPQWRGGHAIAEYGADPFFGVGPQLTHAFNALSGHGPLVDLLTWGVLLIEAALAVLWLFPAPIARAAVIAGVLLHLGIGVFLGLGNFAMVMFAALVCIWPPRAEVRSPAPVTTVAGRSRTVEVST